MLFIHYSLKVSVAFLGLNLSVFNKALLHVSDFYWAKENVKDKVTQLFEFVFFFFFFTVTQINSCFQFLAILSVYTKNQNMRLGLLESQPYRLKMARCIEQLQID